MTKPKRVAYDYKAKRKNIDREINYMLAKTISMFEYSGLPETIPARDLERMLQRNGYAFIAEHEGKLYALDGGIGGQLDAYYNPTTIIVANPWLKLNKEYNIQDDGVMMRSDSMEMGLLELYEKYATMLVENDINMVVYGYNSRMQKMMSASDDKTRANANEFMRKLVDGDLSVIGENALFDGLKVHNDKSGSSDVVRSLIEYHQYIKASMMNEVGLATNFNMKRERFISGEVQMNQDSSFPLVYDMMACRLEAVKAINEKFGLNVKVGFGSVWAVNIKEFEDGVLDNVPTLTNQEVDDTSKNEESKEVVEVGTANVATTETTTEGTTEGTTEVETTEVVTQTTEVKVITESTNESGEVVTTVEETKDEVVTTTETGVSEIEGTNGDAQRDSSESVGNSTVAMGRVEE